MQCTALQCNAMQCSAVTASLRAAIVRFLLCEQVPTGQCVVVHCVQWCSVCSECSTLRSRAVCAVCLQVEGRRIVDTLVERIALTSQICIVTLALFEVGWRSAHV
jgi:hypothetical protein